MATIPILFAVTPRRRYYFPTAEYFDSYYSDGSFYLDTLRDNGFDRRRGRTSESFAITIGSYCHPSVRKNTAHIAIPYDYMPNISVWEEDLGITVKIDGAEITPDATDLRSVTVRAGTSAQYVVLIINDIKEGSHTVSIEFPEDIPGGVVVPPYITTPTVVTKAVDNVGNDTASSGGTISSNGGATITAKGICWKKTPGPTTSNSYTNEGSGSGTFVSQMTGLSVNTTYYVRAYATNSEGTGYGNEVSFTTSSNATVPTVSLDGCSNVTMTTATATLTIVDDGGITISAGGVCWDVISPPTTGGSKTTQSTSEGTFTVSLTGLVPDTEYYICAYATNAIGTTYSGVTSFTTEADVVLPVVTLTTPYMITSEGCDSGGDVTSDGGASVTAKGVCWAETTAPVIATDSFTTDGTGTGPFTSYVEGLSDETLYYIRAYATNSEGTAYSDEQTFTTAALGDVVGLQTITTNPVSEITSNSAKSGGVITSTDSPGYATITAKGICWSLLHDPTTSDDKTIITTEGASFSSSMTDLLPGVYYYVRAYVTNSAGTAYGTEVEFQTANYAVGDLYGGGMVMYTDGDQGLIVALEDLAACKWDNNTSPVATGSTSTALGDGDANTFDEYTDLGEQYSGTTRVYTAPELCYTADIEGFTDWFLPSKDELGYFYNNLVKTGLIVSTSMLWSSSEDGSRTNNAWIWNGVLESGVPKGFMSYPKSSVGIKVRPVRIFPTTGLARLYRPSVTTGVSSAIGGTTATVGGTVSSDGGDTISERGVCYSTSSMPTTSSSKVVVAGTTGVMSASLTGLNGLTTYYARAYATNSKGTSYGAQITFTTTAVTSSFAIGDAYQGGYIFYIDGTGEHGLIIKGTDISTNTYWGPLADVTTSDALGHGDENTAAIIAANVPPYELPDNYAAYLCDAHNDGTYSDWFLPSKGEWEEVYLRRATLIASGCSFTSARYWSSSQMNQNYAYAMLYYAGGVSYVYKADNCRVRPIRAF